LILFGLQLIKVTCPVPLFDIVGLQLIEVTCPGPLYHSLWSPATKVDLSCHSLRFSLVSSPGPPFDSLWYPVFLYLCSILFGLQLLKVTYPITLFDFLWSCPVPPFDSLWSPGTKVDVSCNSLRLPLVSCPGPPFDSLWYPVFLYLCSILFGLQLLKFTYPVTSPILFGLQLLQVTCPPLLFDPL
jgi:hypothetical protein